MILYWNWSIRKFKIFDLFLTKTERKFSKPDETGHRLLETAINKFGLSARAYDRILRVARTIADLGGTEQVHSHYISEVIQYRTLDRDLI